MKLFRTFALSTALGLTLTPAFADVTLRYLACVFRGIGAVISDDGGQ
ncbi:MAG: hypothetical protein ACKO1H_00235 [Tabrizicola sp.]